MQLIASVLTAFVASLVAAAPLQPSSFGPFALNYKATDLSDHYVQGNTTTGMSPDYLTPTNVTTINSAWHLDDLTSCGTNFCGNLTFYYEDFTFHGAFFDPIPSTILNSMVLVDSKVTSPQPYNSFYLTPGATGATLKINGQDGYWALCYRGTDTGTAVVNPQLTYMPSQTYTDPACYGIELVVVYSAGADHP
jgi:hypothetical protein